MNPTILTQGQSFQGGTVKYDAQTGKELTTGQTTTLNPAPPPSNAGGITNTGGITMPKISYPKSSTGPVNGLLSYYGSTVDYGLKEAERLASESAAAKTTQTKQTFPFLSALMGSKTPIQVREQAQEETGVNASAYFAAQKASLDELKALNEEYNAEKAKMEEAINATRDNSIGASAGAIDSNVAKIERDYGVRLSQMSSNINTKAAIYEAEQGRFKEAQDYVNQAVADATAETRYNMDMFRTFYDMNQDVIDSLDSKYQDAFKLAMTSAEKAYELDYETKLKAISNAAGLGKTTGYIGLLQDSINAGASPLQAADEVRNFLQQNGVTVSQEDIDYWAREASKLKADPNYISDPVPPDASPEKRSLLSRFFGGSSTPRTSTPQTTSLLPNVYSPETNAQVNSFWSGLFN